MSVYIYLFIYLSIYTIALEIWNSPFSNFLKNWLVEKKIQFSHPFMENVCEGLQFPSMADRNTHCHIDNSDESTEESLRSATVADMS